ncbi:MAG TPA: hypothetical protein VEC16_03290 [Alphaproteobacteria bacterium]|nr:hypothetical protein [Alphaproteobacteria bacterium]
MGFEWITVERPGYLGKTRDSKKDLWDAGYGELGWRLAWQKGDEVIDMEDALKLYEDAYVEYFKKNPGNDPGQLEWLLSRASDVYDTDVSNVNAGLNYIIGDTPSNHIHDIAIRNAVYRLGEKFRGDHLVHVRWIKSEGYLYNPGVVPFHLPELISKEPISTSPDKIWWKPGTIEDFYQRNKLLQEKKDYNFS